MPTSLTDFFSAVFAFCLVEMINEDIISECSVNSFWDPKFGSMFRYVRLDLRKANSKSVNLYEL